MAAFSVLLLGPLAAELPTQRARAQAGCIPPAGGVPYLPGPPQWLDPSPPSGVTRPQVDDPRWAGSLRQDFPTQFGTEATFRALSSGGYIDLTFQSLIDPNGTTQGDTVWLGVGNGSTSHLFMFDLQGTSGAGPTPITGSYFTKTGGGAGGWTAGLPPAWAESIARWVGSGASFYAWVVDLKVKLADAGLGSSFKLWYAITVNQNGLPLTTALYQWPIGGVSTTAPQNVFDQNAVDPSLWGDASIGTAASPCVGGISLTWNQIGADPPPANEIRTISDNDFYALPDYGAFSIVTGMIQARFRFANWGSTITDKQNAPWTDIPLPTAGALNTSLGPIRFTCTHGAPTATTPACPAPDPGNPDHQCMLVELSKVPQAPGVVPNLFFSSDSAVRNMDFVSASRFEAKAEISIKGLPALSGTPTRDVYVYVKTRNMPAHGAEPLWLKHKAMYEARRLSETAPSNGGQLPPFGKADDKHPTPVPLSAVTPSSSAVGAIVPRPLDDTLAKSPYEHLVTAWPSYEVHAFHDSGKILVIGGRQHILIEPMVPFGYFVDHEGALYGWQQTFGAQGAELEPLAENYYRIRIPHGGAVQVKTTIEAEEKPKPMPDHTDHMRIKGGCHCGVVAGSPANRAPVLISLGMLCIGVAVRLGRRRALRLTAASDRASGTRARP